MRPATVGTAGHIDHGKSALVRALTGTDPDRLAEEQRRGMTLDLGFAHLDLPSGARVGIVDVPGHEALIHNMLAGAGGIDLVMLVVAADEGVMPQSREHVDILRFLPIAGGVIVLNKIDLISDPEWLAVVEEDVRSLVAGTVLEGAPAVGVSARTGVGVPDLVAVLDRLVGGLHERQADGPVRLPVDRSFTIQGFGTVVTGTLWSGTIRPGDALEILPGGREVRVRGVQVYGRSTPVVFAGSRVAANLVGVEKDDVARGDVLATARAYQPTDRLDVRLRLLPHAPAVRHAARVHVHLGAGEAIARVALVERARLEPGDEALVQLRLDRPVVAVHGDHFVVRRYSPTRTIGGGVVVHASPPRRRRAQAAEALQTVERSGPQALIVSTVVSKGQTGMPLVSTASAAGLDAASAATALTAAQAQGQVVVIGERLYAAEVADEVGRQVEDALAAYHSRVAWRRGMPREELKSQVVSGPDDRLFNHIMKELAGRARIVEHHGLVALGTHRPQVTDAEQHTQIALRSALERAATSPPGPEALRPLGTREAVDRMLQALADDGAIVQVAPDVRFATTAVESVRKTVVEMARGGQDVTVATLRDRLHTSRKFALALLEYLDAIRVTRRVGDRRVLGPHADDPVPAAR